VFATLIVKPDEAEALGVPLALITGSHPWLVKPAVQ